MQSPNAQQEHFKKLRSDGLKFKNKFDVRKNKYFKVPTSNLYSNIFQ